jgi:hypothetical protein
MWVEPAAYSTCIHACGGIRRHKHLHGAHFSSANSLPNHSTNEGMAAAIRGATKAYRRHLLSSFLEAGCSCDGALRTVWKRQGPAWCRCVAGNQQQQAPSQQLPGSRLQLCQAAAGPHQLLSKAQKGRPQRHRQQQQSIGNQKPSCADRLNTHAQPCMLHNHMYRSSSCTHPHPHTHTHPCLVHDHAHKIDV